ncbi:unnamed protein product [Blepharisma stoltei]|uniref:RCC1-like domain-containing protein n=1 Tax=Blepharisma stoltei TaxID=1481888 RepID=A0AAU9JAX2_9CILI|nr:unnamed protein product [Blepharisma stoltei]
MEGYTEIFAWGGDHFGQLGLGESKNTGKTYPFPRYCSYNVLIKEISCGEEHSAFIALSGYVYSMGSNSEGRLGLGDKSLRQSSSPILIESLDSYKAAKISCGWGHTCVITVDGDLFSWGVGEFGALGIGINDTQWKPIRVDLPNRAKALQISCGSRHTGLIAEENKRNILFMWGAGEAGQLGTGRREKELLPILIQTNEEPKQVSCGIFHTMFLCKSGSIFSMGGNSFGQLGVGNKKSTSRPQRIQYLEDNFIEKIACGHHSAAITDQGELFIWGTGVFGEYLYPQRVTSIARFIDVSIGGSFGIAIGSNHELYAWGANSNGELGLGNFENRISPTSIVALKGRSVNKISCGGSYCIALGEDVVKQNKLGKSARHVSPLQTDQSYYTSRNKEVSENSRNSWMRSSAREAFTSREPRALEDDSAIFKSHSEFRPNDTFSSKEIYESKTRNVSSERKRDWKEQPFLRESFENQYRSVSIERPELSFGSTNGNSFRNGADLEKANIELKEKTLELRGAKLEIERLNEALKNFQTKNERLEYEYQELSNQFYRNKPSLEFSNKEILQLRQSLDEFKYQSKSIANENEILKEDLAKFKLLYEELSQSKSTTDGFYQELQEKLQAETIKRKQIEKDLEVSNNHWHRLEDALSQSHSNLESYIQQLNEEKVYNEKLTQELSDLRKNFHGLNQDKETISYMLQDTQNQAEDQILQLIDENKRLKETVQNLNYDIEKLNSTLAGKSSNIGEFVENQKELEDRMNNLKDENYQLKISLADSEAKNKQLFEHLDKELAARAREYKERTLNLISTPVRNYSSSPLVNRHQGQSSPFKAEEAQLATSRNRNYLSQESQERIANATSKVIESTNIESPLKNMRVSSPSRKSPEKSPQISLLKSSGSTPSRNDIKARIAALAESRSKLEMKLEELEN